MKKLWQHHELTSDKKYYSALWKIITTAETRFSPSGRGIENFAGMDFSIGCWESEEEWFSLFGGGGGGIFPDGGVSKILASMEKRRRPHHLPNRKFESYKGGKVSQIFTQQNVSKFVINNISCELWS